jgi:hypothetical protein
MARAGTSKKKDQSFAVAQNLRLEEKAKDATINREVAALRGALSARPGRTTRS